MNELQTAEIGNESGFFISFAGEEPVFFIHAFSVGKPQIGAGALRVQLLCQLQHRSFVAVADPALVGVDIRRGNDQRQLIPAFGKTWGRLFLSGCTNSIS